VLRNVSIFVLIYLASFLVSDASAPSAPNVHSQTRYKVAAQLELRHDVNGINGTLQLMLDKALPTNLNDYSPLDDTSHYVPAVLRIVGLTDSVVIADTLKRPVATISLSRELNGEPPWYELMVDYSVGWGSYAGPITSFIRVRGGRLESLQATGQSTGKTDTVFLMRSLKTDWRFYVSPKTGTLNILEVACRPHWNASNRDTVEFNITYTRFYPKADKWMKVKKTVKGFWESEDKSSFPDVSKFPW
jgi:hypothetical protein